MVVPLTEQKTFISYFYSMAKEDNEEASEPLLLLSTDGPIEEELTESFAV